MKAATVGPRERAMEVGVEAVGDGDLVAIVLGTGHAGRHVGAVAAALIVECGGLPGLARHGAGALALLHGIGTAKGLRLAAAVEIGRRVAEAEAKPRRIKLPASGAVAAWGRPRLSRLDHEELWVLCLDSHNGLGAARRVAMGGIHGVSVAVRDPLRMALREGASSVVLVHNHPSGDPTPSAEDLRFTQSFAEAASCVGAPLLDHVIVARRGYVSFLDEGLIARSRGLSPPHEKTRQPGRHDPAHPHAKKPQRSHPEGAAALPRGPHDGPSPPFTAA